MREQVESTILQRRKLPCRSACREESPVHCCRNGTRNSWDEPFLQITERKSVFAGFAGARVVL